MDQVPKVTPSCANCPLGGSQCRGDGPEKTPLVIVGEAPGYNEVAEGIPFVGASGQLLNATLKELGVPRSAVYVTNVVMCRPTKDDKDAPPTRGMINACHDRLVGDIRSRVPRIILAVGSTASQALLGKEAKISEVQGSLQWNKEIGCWILPTYHPAAVLHGNSGYFDDIYEATKRAILIAKGQLKPPDRSVPQWRLITNPAQAIWLFQGWIETADELAVDTESRTLLPTGPRSLDDEWLTIQVYDGGEASFSFNLRELLKFQDVRNQLEDLFKSKTTFWWHNLTYDLQVLKANGFTAPSDSRDTMILGLGLTERQEQTGLEALSRTYCFAPYYKDKLGRNGYSYMQGPQNQDQWNDLAEYGCEDVYYTWLLKETLPDLVAQEGTWDLCQDLLLPAAIAFSEDPEFRGTLVDIDYAQEVEAEWLPIIEKAEKEMQEYARSLGFPHDPDVVKSQFKAAPCPSCVVARYPKLGELLLKYERKEWRDRLAQTKFGDPSCSTCMKRRFKLVVDDKLNVRSYVHLQHLAFDILHLRHPEWGRRSCEEAFLAYNESSEFTRLLRAIRERDGILRNYIRGISDDIWSDGRIHPDFLLAGTVTGRLAIHNPPLQTLPKWGVSPEMAKIVRKLIISSPMEYDDANS